MMDTTLMIAVIGGLVVGVPIGMFLWNMVLARSARSLRALSERAQREGAELVAAAERDATVVRERQVVEAREEAVAIKEEAAREAARRRDEVDKAERRVADREAQVGERQDRLRTEEKAVEQRRGDFAAREQGLMARQAELTRLHAEVQQRLGNLLSMVGGEQPTKAASSVSKPTVMIDLDS